MAQLRTGPDESRNYIVGTGGPLRLGTYHRIVVHGSHKCQHEPSNLRYYNLFSDQVRNSY